MHFPDAIKIFCMFPGKFFFIARLIFANMFSDIVLELSNNIDAGTHLIIVHSRMRTNILTDAYIVLDVRSLHMLTFGRECILNFTHSSIIWTKSRIFWG